MDADPGEPLSLFERALVYASRVHAEQKRKGSKTPYVGHLLEVCGLVLAAGGDEEQAIAALLHDAPEDQGGRDRLADVRARFGERVASIVEGCTDTFEQPKPPWRARKEAYLEHLREADADVLLVSLADKVANARALVADYRTEGEALWSRFNPDADQRWYYRALADVFLERCPGQLARELDLAVSDLEQEIEGRSGRAADRR